MAKSKEGIIKVDRLSARVIAEAMGVDPFLVLLQFVKGDYEALGMPATRTKFTSQGQPYPEETITPEMRLDAAKMATAYLYPKLGALKVVSDGEEQTHQQGVIRDVKAITKQDIIDAIKQDPFFQLEEAKKSEP